MRAEITSPLAQTAAGAVAADVLRACVHCGFCNATCPTFQITGDELDGPRGRIYLMKQALEGEPVGRLTQHHLDRCLSCRACETTCPSGVEYHRLLDVGRAEIATKVARPWNERLARWAIRMLSARAWLLRPLLMLGGKTPRHADSSRKRPREPEAGAQPRRMSLLTGCVQSAAAPHFNAATRRVFATIGVGLKETPSARCCGAVAFHLDAAEEARAHVRRNVDAWIAELDAGSEAIVVNASGCAAFIRDYPDVLADDPAYADKARRVARAVRDPVEILRQAEPRATRAPAYPRIAVHDPCTLRNGPGLEGAVAALLAGLGYDPQPVADPHLCCGSAGAYSLLQPRLAGRLRADKLAALTVGRPAVVYTANIGCWMHLGETSGVPVRHWIEAVDAVVDGR
jgi:glycolate oxidase iron-sulfur subunit